MAIISKPPVQQGNARKLALRGQGVQGQESAEQWFLVVIVSCLQEYALSCCLNRARCCKVTGMGFNWDLMLLLMLLLCIYICCDIAIAYGQCRAVHGSSGGPE